MKEHPKTVYLNEINFRIGEYLFDNQEYDKAIHTYNKTIKTWDDPFFAMALYKLAWCYYKIDNYSQAISTFFYLLNDLDMLDSLKCAEIGRTTVDLRDESIRYIAICFSEYGELKLARSFFRDLKCSQAYKIQILHRMGDVYRKRSYYDKALSIYHGLVKQYPAYENAPEIHKSIFDCYNSQGMEVKALKAREMLVKNFGPKSRWSASNTDPDSKERVAQYIKDIDFILATPVINKADELLSRGNMKDAVKVYCDFVRNFPEDERAPRALFNSAECQFEDKKFHKAAQMYQLLVRKYAPHELTEDAAFNRVICYDKLFQLETGPEPDTLVFNFSRKKHRIPAASKAQKNLLLACNDFLKAVPRGDKTVEILLKSAEQLAKLEIYQLSEDILRKAIDEITLRRNGQEFYTSAASLMAQVSYKQNKFKAAEQWYSLVAKSASDSVELTQNSLKMMASSRYKIAEKLMAKGDSARAAREFERVALRFGNSEVVSAQPLTRRHNTKKMEKSKKPPSYSSFSRGDILNPSSSSRVCFALRAFAKIWGIGKWPLKII